MDEFEALVKKCSSKNLDYNIQNASKRHAHILMKYLIDRATEKKEDIRIVTGCLETGFYDALIENLQQFLNQSGKSISVIILDPSADLQGNKFSDLILKSRKGSVLITKDRVEHPHFILVGKSSYRFEIDDRSTKAVANFNDSDIGAFLYDMYDGLLPKAEPIQQIAA